MRAIARHFQWPAGLAVLAVAAACAAGCRGSGSTSMATWEGARFSVSHPSGWEVREATAERVVVDGTKAAGAFRVGRELEVRLMPKAVPAPADRFDVHCGSHRCEARLEIETGAFRLVLSEACDTDACPRQAALEAGLRELSRAVLPTLKAQ